MLFYASLSTIKMVDFKLMSNKKRTEQHSVSPPVMRHSCHPAASISFFTKFLCAIMSYLYCLVKISRAVAAAATPNQSFDMDPSCSNRIQCCATDERTAEAPAHTNDRFQTCPLAIFPNLAMQRKPTPRPQEMAKLHPNVYYPGHAAINYAETVLWETFVLSWSIHPFTSPRDLRRLILP